MNFVLWWGVTVLLLLVGVVLYGRAAYDAWGESNVDKRIFWGGALAGFAVAWFLRGPL